MRVIERTDRFTLIGADARRGKVTLFEAEGPRELGALRHIGLRVSLPSATAPPSSTPAKGCASCSSRRRPRSTTTSTTWRSSRSIRTPPSTEWRRLGFESAGERRARGRRRVPRRARRRDPGEPERPLLNHVGVLVESVEEHIAEARRARRRGRRRRRRAEHDRALRLGPRAREARVHRAQADVLADLTRPSPSRAPGWRGSWPPRGCGSSGATYECSSEGTRSGGSMLLSSGVIWRHRELDAFRRDCPRGDPALQDACVGAARRRARLAGVARRSGPRARHGQPADGRPPLRDARVDRARCTSAPAEVRLGEPLGEQDGEVVLATGGFGVRFAEDRGLALRAAPWSDGRGIAFALARGAELSAGQDEFYGRAMPAPPARWGEADFVRAAQLYGRWAEVVDDDGAPVFEGKAAWHENDLAQSLARVPSAWYRIADSELDRRVRGRAIADMVRTAEELGAEVRRTAGTTAVRVAAAVTHTIGGLRIDTRARVLDDLRRPGPGPARRRRGRGRHLHGRLRQRPAAALVLGLARRRGSSRRASGRRSAGGRRGAGRGRACSPGSAARCPRPRCRRRAARPRARAARSPVADETKRRYRPPPFHSPCP